MPTPITHSPAPPWATILQRHPKADAFAARLEDGREVLFVDGREVPLAPECVKPSEVLGLLLQAKGKDLRKSLDHLRSLGTKD